VPAWSPDGRWIALFAIGAKRFTNVELVPATGGVMRPISFLANAYANTLAWSPDGTFILFDVAAHRGRRARACRFASTHAAVPRGFVPRPVHGAQTSGDAYARAFARRSARARNTPGCAKSTG
jgi:sugar lactone lactonase YvrE